MKRWKSFLRGFFAGLAEVARGEAVMRVGIALQGDVVDARVVPVRRRWGPQKRLIQAYVAVMVKDYVAKHPESHGRLETRVAAPSCVLLPWYVLVYAGWRLPCVVASNVRVKVMKKAGFWPNVWNMYVLKGDVVAGRDVTCTPLAQPKGVARADPFVADIGGKMWLLYEEYSAKVMRGVLKVSPWNGVTVDAGHMLMERAHHVSYPQIVTMGGQTFLLPETHAAGKVELLPCHLGADGLPELGQATLAWLEGENAADATLWRDETGVTWLFVSLSRVAGFVDHSVEMHLFKVDDGVLVPHAGNPVVRDCRYARCAGPVFKDARGRWIRPVQAYEGGMYGTRINFMEIQDISAGAYREECVGTLNPDFSKGLNGTHHICRVADGTYVVDARKAWERVA